MSTIKMIRKLIDSEPTKVHDVKYFFDSHARIVCVRNLETDILEYVGTYESFGVDGVMTESEVERIVSLLKKGGYK